MPGVPYDTQAFEDGTGEAALDQPDPDDFGQDPGYDSGQDPGGWGGAEGFDSGGFDGGGGF